MDKKQETIEMLKALKANSHDTTLDDAAAGLPARQSLMGS